MPSVAGFGPCQFDVLSLRPAPVNLESTFTVRRHVTWAIHLISHKGGARDTLYTGQLPLASSRAPTASFRACF